MDSGICHRDSNVLQEKQKKLSRLWSVAALQLRLALLSWGLLGRKPLLQKLLDIIHLLRVSRVAKVAGTKESANT